MRNRTLSWDFLTRTEGAHSCTKNELTFFDLYWIIPNYKWITYQQSTVDDYQELIFGPTNIFCTSSVNIFQRQIVSNLPHWSVQSYFFLKRFSKEIYLKNQTLNENISRQKNLHQAGVKIHLLCVQQTPWFLVIE